MLTEIEDIDYYHNIVFNSLPTQTFDSIPGAYPLISSSIDEDGRSRTLFLVRSSATHRQQPTFVTLQLRSCDAAPGIEARQPTGTDWLGFDARASV